MESGRTWAEISISALLHNYRAVRRMCGNIPVMAVVKADAYGHGGGFVVPALMKEGVAAFAVSNLDEAVEVRGLCADLPVLILGYTPPTQAKTLAKYRVTQALLDADYAKELSDNAVLCGVTVDAHLAFDTGMGRIGFNCRTPGANGARLAAQAAALPGLSVKGAFTHFAVADSKRHEDVLFTSQQHDRFFRAVASVRQSGTELNEVHCSNSAGMMYHSVDDRMAFARAGIVLYGLRPEAALAPCEPLIPVMTLKSTVSMVKTLEMGATVSYGRTFTASHEMRVATVSAGYADGYPRSLSGRASVYVCGQMAPIVGRVCMDQFMIDVSAIRDVKPGDEVELFGTHIPAETVAAQSDRINYEVICGISKRVPRIAVS